MIRVALREHVKGFAKLSNFSVDTVAAPAKSQLRDGQVILRPLYISVDPHQRGSMDKCALNEPISNYLVARVVASAANELRPGDTVTDMSGKWQTEYIADAKNIRLVPEAPGVDVRDHLGVLGVTAFTAYYGFKRARAQRGETILVSSASGGVGQVVVQLAKAAGLRVVGVAGSDAKVQYVKDLGADAAFNYKTCGDFVQAIRQSAPEGVDVYFDNVAGPFLDAAILNLNHSARIIGCGVTSQKNAETHDDIYGLKNLFDLIAREAELIGINVGGHFGDQVHRDFVKEVSELYRNKAIRYKVHEMHGLESAPQALLDLYSGKNFGKTIIKV